MRGNRHSGKRNTVELSGIILLFTVGQRENSINAACYCTDELSGRGAGKRHLTSPRDEGEQQIVLAYSLPY